MIEDDDQLFAEITGTVGHDLNVELDRERLKGELLAAFGQISKSPVDNVVLQHRIQQIESFAENLKVEFDQNTELVVTPDTKDELVFELLRLGCGWHDSLDVLAVVRSCLPE